MSRRRVGATLAVLALAAAAVAGIAALRGDEAVDEEEYDARNLRLLAELPVFPGSRPLTTIRDRCAGRDGRVTASGFFTSRSFGLPRETSRARLIGFYRTRMPGWRAEEELKLRMLGFRRGEQYVRMLVVSPREYVLKVDHRGDACPAP